MCLSHTWADTTVKGQVTLQAIYKAKHSGGSVIPKPLLLTSYRSTSKNYHYNAVKYRSQAKSGDCTWRSLVKASKAPSKDSRSERIQLQIRWEALA